MAAQSYSSLIDIASSWSDISVVITPESSAKLDSTDIAAISHSGTIERGEQRGASGGRRMKRTTGSVSYEASITFYRSGLRKLVEALIAAAPDYAIRGNQVRIGLVNFDVDIQHSPPGATAISHHRLKGCVLNGYTDDMAEGNDADQIEIPIDPMENVQIVDGQEIVLL